MVIYVFNIKIQFIIVLSAHYSVGFLLSPVPNIIIKDSATVSYFGYAVVLREQSIIIGAPRAKSEQRKNVTSFESGTVYRCIRNSKTSSIATCKRYIFQKIPNKNFHNSQWLGAVMDGGPRDDASLLVCAPRYIGREEGALPGICYMSLDTLSEFPNTKQQNWQLQPMITLALVYSINTAEMCAMGQAGFSAHITPDAEVLLGAPGALIWRGTVVRNVQFRNDIPYDLGDKNDSYAGYAVASGYLNYTNPQQLLYVTSVPHAVGVEELGEVLIFDYMRDHTTQKHVRLRGLQYAEFFGYALLVLDINGDGCDDLLVTAPLHGRPHHADVGVVHVFLNRGTMHFERQLLHSPFAAMARFGTTISSLSDINLDGFNDVAIGAPFANSNGAIAIYLGSAEGLQTTPSQILDLSAVELPQNRLQNPEPLMFGHGLSKGVDIDGNGYNDLAVGAPGAAMVFIYRAYPVVRILTTVSMSKSDIVSGFQLLEYCWHYVTNSTKFNGRPQLSLSFVIRHAMLPKSSQPVLTINVTAEKWQQCQQYMANISALISHEIGVFQPLIAEMRHKLLHDGVMSKDFCETCVVLDPAQPILSATSKSKRTQKANDRRLLSQNWAHLAGLDKQWNYLAKVPNETVEFCQLLIQRQSEPQIMLTNSSCRSIILHYTISNMASEPCYDSRITIVVTSDVNYVRIPTHCQIDATFSNKLECVLNRLEPFAVGAHAQLQMKLDIMQMKDDQLSVRIAPLYDEVIQLKLPVELRIIGKPIIPLINLNEIMENYIVQHYYKLHNIGQRTLHDSIITIMLPVAFRDKYFVDIKHNITLLQQQLTDNSRHSQNWRLLNSTRLTRNENDVTVSTFTDKNKIVLRCSNIAVICATFDLKVTHLMPQQSLIIQYDHKVMRNELRDIMQTTEYLQILHDVHIKNLTMESLEVDKQLEPLEIVILSTMPSVATLGIAVAVGVILYGFITYLLYKCGFMRRTIKLKMQEQIKLMAETAQQGDSVIENDMTDS